VKLLIRRVAALPTFASYKFVENFRKRGYPQEEQMTPPPSGAMGVAGDQNPRTGSSM